jgi:transcriptional regulator with XRE-family HTH domain
MTFSEKLRALRDACGLSETKLAQASGLTFASVHGYGLGRRTPSFPAVIKLARALGVTCQAFADCEDMGPETPAPKARSKKTAGKEESAPSGFETSAKKAGKRKGNRP